VNNIAPDIDDNNGQPFPWLLKKTSQVLFNLTLAYFCILQVIFLLFFSLTSSLFYQPLHKDRHSHPNSFTTHINTPTQQNQTKRLDDFPRLNWPMPPEEVGDAECSALKTVWEPLITAEFAALVFDKKKLSLGQDGCVGVVADLIAQLQGPYARQHSDLLLRYVHHPCPVFKFLKVLY
jgi:hypothetical protein